MKLADIQIRTQLRVGLGLILALMMVLGAVSWRQANQLWLQTKAVIDHPLRVSAAVGALGTDIAQMSVHVRDARLARNEHEVEAALQGLEVDRSHAAAQLAILGGQYLGPRDDIIGLQEDLARWNSLRDETIRILRAGNTEQATDRLMPGGVQTRQRTAVVARLATIGEFARGKAAELQQEATDRRDALNRQLAMVFALSSILALAISGLLLRGITYPLAKLTAAADAFRQGNLEARCPYVSGNELGALAAAFNTMADQVQDELVFGQRVALVNAAMLDEFGTDTPGQRILEPLMEVTGSQIGAIYAVNDQGTKYEHLRSVGLGSAGRASFSATTLEGELGRALATGRIQRIKDIPADTSFTFSAVSGEFRPREIVTIPLRMGKEVSALISLASVCDFDPTVVRLLDELQSALAVWMRAMLARRRIQALTDDLGSRNRELETQTKELTSQSKVLAEQNLELEAQKRQLDEANRLKSTFLSNMSHELRTPLNSVIALSGVLSRRLATSIPAEEKSYLEVIERNGKNLLALINDILDLSRIEAGREELRVVRFSVCDLAGEVVAMLETQAHDKGLVLLSEVPADLPILNSDADKCRHILQNLVANSVKFTEKGRVTIAAKPTDHAIELSVRDTGIGIARNHLATIFEEFRQVDDGTARKHGGTGLGLSIARKYARFLGGDIEVSSVLGEGSTFTVTLPLVLRGAAASQGPELRAAHRAATRPAASGQRLLLVEDSEPAILQMSDILVAEGYKVEVARDGKEALEAIPDAKPDAIILDLMMPGVDGFQVLKAIRDEPRTAHLPVLILTAKHVSKEELAFLSGNGIHELIQKGDIDSSGLLSAIAQVVAPRSAEPMPRAPRKRRGLPRVGKPVVLVVEDNPDNLRTVTAMLEDRYQVVEARDGQQGVEQARRHLPDVILMDIAMPVLDGIQALAALRQEEALRDIPVFATTASAMTGDRASILAHGFDRYISKPIDYDLLMDALRQALGD